MSLIIPVFIIFILIFSRIKKVKSYDSFVSGSKGAIPLCVTLFPYIVGIFILVELFKASGMFDLLDRILTPVFAVLGIPKGLSEIIILKPFSGGGSLALLTNIYEDYGIDSYISLCASCIYGSSETVFYVSATYFTNTKDKKLTAPILISLIATFISTVFCCFICHFFV